MGCSTLHRFDEFFYHISRLYLVLLNFLRAIWRRITRSFCCLFQISLPLSRVSLYKGWKKMYLHYRYTLPTVIFSHQYPIFHLLLAQYNLKKAWWIRYESSKQDFSTEIKFKVRIFYLLQLIIFVNRLDLPILWDSSCYTIQPNFYDLKRMETGSFKYFYGLFLWCWSSCWSFAILKLNKFIVFIVCNL